jgi:hypothetical protein
VRATGTPAVPWNLENMLVTLVLLSSALKGNEGGYVHLGLINLVLVLQ